MKKNSYITGVVLLLVIFLTCFTCTYFDPTLAAGGKPSLYFMTDNGMIFRAPLEEPQDFREIFQSPSGMMATLDVDPLGGYIYWSLDTMDRKSIHRVRLDGSEHEEILTTGNPANSIAIDPRDKTMYFAEGTFINKTPLNADETPESFFESPNVIDITYITLNFSDNEVVCIDSMDCFFVNMNDSGQYRNVSLFNWPEQVAIDYFDDFIYYMSGGEIFREAFPPDGNPPLVVYAGGSASDFVLDRKNGFIYFLEGFVLYRVPANVSGTSEMILNSTFLGSDIMQLTIDLIQ
jgi:hypothetical protein